MKKTILHTLAFVAVLTFSTQLKAQFILSNYIVESTVLDDSTTIDSYVTVENHSADTLYLHVERTLLSMVPNHEESFCFGPNCYPPGTLMSIDPAIIPPGSSDYSFHATLLPYYTCGTSYVHYRFFNQNNTSDSIGIDLSFGFCTATGIHELSSAYGVSRPTINPANNFTSFNYRMEDNNGQAHIALYNMLGTLVKSFPIPQKSGELVINTSDLKAGLYLCSVVNNNRVTNTYKLVVEHK